MLESLSLIGPFVVQMLCMAILVAIIVPILTKNGPVQLPGIFTLLLGIIIAYLLGQYDILSGLGEDTGGDRMLYFNAFNEAHYKRTSDFLTRGDPLFQALVWFLASVFDAYQILMIIAFMYVLLYVWISSRISSKYSLLVFLAFACYFQFTSYGINTIRAGLGGAVAILGMTYWRRTPIMLLIFAIAFGIHGSMIIPIAAFICARFFRLPNLYVILWVLAIPISFASGEFFNDLFYNLFDFDKRVDYLTNTEDTLYETGFRFDFVLYSAFPVAMGFIYTLWLKYRSHIYQIFFSTYLLANIFFILVIRSNFTDRFAYLSWMISPIVLIYPLLQKPDLTPYRGFMLLGVLLIEAGFTCYMIFA